MRQNCDGLQQHAESVDDNAMVPESDWRWVQESKFTTETTIDPIPVPEKSDKADQALGKAQEQNVDNPRLVAEVGGSQEVEETPEVDKTVAKLDIE